MCLLKTYESTLFITVSNNMKHGFPMQRSYCTVRTRGLISVLLGTVGYHVLDSRRIAADKRAYCLLACLLPTAPYTFILVTNII